MSDDALTASTIEDCSYAEGEGQLGRARCYILAIDFCGDSMPASWVDDLSQGDASNLRRELDWADLHLCDTPRESGRLACTSLTPVAPVHYP
jgi:hypothetical protein